ncbi:MAG: apolipoprotein N-acyltransferase [Thermodesulfobacteriota bacterium]
MSAPLKQTGQAALAGALLYAASPGPQALPLLAWFALLPLFLAIDGVPVRRAATLGFVCGLVFFLPLLSFIVIVLSTYGGVAYPVAVAVMILLAVYMALFPALFAGILQMLGGAGTSIWIAPGLWVGLDWLRGVLLTGFPWLDLGYTQYRQALLLQSADLGGHFAVTFLLVLASALLFRLLRRQSRRWHCNELPAALLLLGALVYGGFQLAAYRQSDAGTPSQRLVIVQGSIEQDEKWQPGQELATVLRYTGLSAGAQPGDLLVWPETALPFYPAGHPLFGEHILPLLRDRQTWLLTGTPYAEKVGGRVRYLNRAVLITPDGDIAGHYDKQHLVPFGEYIPFRSVFSFLSPVVETMADFSPGLDTSLLSGENAQIGALVCFESIFPELARAQVTAGADLLVNITNDAWFGRSNAAYQHLAMAVLRAVENRRGLARAANTGISGFISPAGEISGETSMFVPAAVSGRLPLIERLSVFSRFGHWFAPGCAALSLIALILGRGRRRPVRQGR